MHEIEYRQINSLPERKLSSEMLWHRRLGHASGAYLKKMAENFPDTVKINKTLIDKNIADCETCLITKSCKLPFTKVRTRATKPLQIVHADTMGPISLIPHPKEYRFIVIFTDDYSRVAQAYPMKHKTGVSENLRNYIKSMRNLLGKDEKFCYLRCDRGTEFTGAATVKVFNKYGAELQLMSPDTPEHNGTAERINRTVQTKVRAYMFDSELPPSMWDLAVKAGIYVYNRTPHKANEMIAPLKKLIPSLVCNLEQIKRFGCPAYSRITRKEGTKFLY